MLKKLGAATCVPLALAAVHITGWAQSPDYAPALSSEADLGATFAFHYEGVLGTSLDIRVRALDPASAERAERAALAEFDRQDKILSSWRRDSELSRWSSTRFVPTPVSPELFRTLAQFEH